MKKILAVSGGVDSMVMLDFLVRGGGLGEGDGVVGRDGLVGGWDDLIGGGDGLAGGELVGGGDVGEMVVVHFNHGIRENSDEDEDFVRRVAGELGVEFRSRKEELGAGAGEALARERRYRFLDEVADECRGEIYVAHHRDDLVESAVINLLRGTGWRGLAPMMGGVRRPLLGWGKVDILKYAAVHGVRWRLDYTNSDDGYLRNRVREWIGGDGGKSKEEALGVLSSVGCSCGKMALIAGIFPARNTLESTPKASSLDFLPSSASDLDFSQVLTGLIGRQREIAGEVDRVLGEVLPMDGRYRREWFVGLDDGVGVEILRMGLMRVGRKATRPQLVEFLRAVREYGAGKAFNLSGDYLVHFQKDDFMIE